MKTPNLLDVPKTGLSRRQKIRAFKKEHGIETHCGSGWVAAHLPSAREFGYGCTEDSDLFECFSHVGRLMDESGVASYGLTEMQAIRAVCAVVKIACPF